MQHTSIVRRGAAAITAAALALGASTLLAPAAEAKAKKKPLKGNLTGTVALSCVLPAFGETSRFDYDAKIKITAKRAKKADKKVALTASFNDMPPVAPVAITNQDLSGSLVLTAGTTKATLKGTKTISAAVSAPVPMPTVKGNANNKKNSLPITITKLDTSIMGIAVNCVPAESGALGTLKLK